MSNSPNHNVHHGSTARNPPRGAPTDAARTARRFEHDAPEDECERLLDDELTGTFPASDPPSWTMGGSLVSTLRH